MEVGGDYYHQPTGETGTVEGMSMSVNQRLSHEVLARVVASSDADGPYYEIRMGDRLLAYSDALSSAELIVVALNTATALTVMRLPADTDNHVN